MVFQNLHLVLLGNLSMHTGCLSLARDPEYVAQMDNILNGHLRHTAIFLSLTIVATTIALGFHSILLDWVSGVTGSQWAAQVGNPRVNSNIWSCYFGTAVP